MIEKFETKEGNICIISSFSNLFNNIGSNISDIDIFILGSGLDFNFKWEESMQNPSEIILHHYSSEAIENFFSYIKHPVRYDDTPHDYKECMDFLKGYIDRNDIVIISVNTQFLTYHPYYKDLKKNREHVLSIIGYGKDEFYISDCFVPGLNHIKTYQGLFNFKDCYEAIKLSDYKYYNFDHYSAVNKINQISTLDIEKYFYFIIEKYLKNDINKLYMFADKVKKMNLQFPIETLKTSADDFYFMIKFNGIISSRIFILKYLNEKSLHIHNYKRLNTIINQWNYFNIMLFKNSATECSEEKYKYLGTYLVELLNAEKELYNDILKTRVY